jgi:hypothetical protein
LILWYTSLVFTHKRGTCADSRTETTRCFWCRLEKNWAASTGARRKLGRHRPWQSTFYRCSLLDHAYWHTVARSAPRTSAAGATLIDALFAGVTMACGNNCLKYWLMNLILNGWWSTQAIAKFIGTQREPGAAIRTWAAQKGAQHKLHLAVGAHSAGQGSCYTRYNSGLYSGCCSDWWLHCREAVGGQRVRHRCSSCPGRETGNVAGHSSEEKSQRSTRLRQETL